MNQISSILDEGLREGALGVGSTIGYVQLGTTGSAFADSDFLESLIRARDEASKARTRLKEQGTDPNDWLNQETTDQRR